jgi:hypothetical protein
MKIHNELSVILGGPILGIHLTTASSFDSCINSQSYAPFTADFRRRFMSLLGFQFSMFTPALALR